MIHMFLGLQDPDPDPFVRGTDPDPDPFVRGTDPDPFVRGTDSDPDHSLFSQRCSAD